MPCSTQLVLERRRHVRDRTQHDIAAVAPGRPRRRRVETEAQPRGTVDRNRVGGIEIVAALQARHAIGAIEMIDDVAEVDLVDRRPRRAVITAVDADPHGVSCLECDAVSAGAKGPDQQGIEAGRALARLLDPSDPSRPSSGHRTADEAVACGSEEDDRLSSILDALRFRPHCGQPAPGAQRRGLPCNPG